MSKVPFARFLLVCHRSGDGKNSVGGQKRRWNGVASMDLKKSDLLPDWHDLWCGLVWAATVEVNILLGDLEKEKK